jgi:hypothetical protein
VPALDPIVCTRIVATAEAIDGTRWPESSLCLRVAPDEVLVIAHRGADAGTDRGGGAADPADISDIRLTDPHAIVERDTGWRGAWVPSSEAIGLLARECRWELPRTRPAFAQGAVADLPVKIWFTVDRVLIIVASPFAADLEERLR